MSTTRSKLNTAADAIKVARRQLDDAAHLINEALETALDAAPITIKQPDAGSAKEAAENFRKFRMRPDERGTVDAAEVIGSASIRDPEKGTVTVSIDPSGPPAKCIDEWAIILGGQYRVLLGNDQMVYECNGYATQCHLMPTISTLRYDALSPELRNCYRLHIPHPASGIIGDIWHVLRMGAISERVREVYYPRTLQATLQGNEWGSLEHWQQVLYEYDVSTQAQITTSLWRMRRSVRQYFCAETAERLSKKEPDPEWMRPGVLED